MTRVAIVTTIDRNSAIALATLQAATALAELADVTIFAEPTIHPLDCPLPLRLIDDGRIRTHDHVVTVIGDSPFHVDTFLAARRMPSVVILHDVLIAHLVATAMPLRDLSRELVRWYGPRQAAIVMRSARTPRPFWDGPTPLDAPLFESAIEFATGVVVHSNFAADVVCPRTIAPVRVVPLAYETPRSGSAPVKPIDDGSAVLLTLGHANPNKCHELVIEALAELADPTVRYVVAGLVTDRRRRSLEGLATSLGVGSRVDIVGHVSADRVSELLRSATVCMNLRMPALEGASASLVEQMAAGKCVVVFDHGCYADAPDDAVVKLPTNATPPVVAQAVRDLLDSSARRECLAERARRHVATVHSAKRYASQLLDFFGEVESAEPLTRLVRRVASVTRSWGMPHGSPLAHRWAAAITSMTSGVDADSVDS
jgi:glycosyltransferase involved in cell wall biosynthesis